MPISSLASFSIPTVSLLNFFFHSHIPINVACTSLVLESHIRLHYQQTLAEELKTCRAPYVQLNKVYIFFLKERLASYEYKNHYIDYKKATYTMLYRILVLLSIHACDVVSTQCYWINGAQATSDFQPCNSNVAAGSQSYCCNLGKSPADTCLGSGLCQRQDAGSSDYLIYAVGCTDPTGKNANCPQYCAGELNSKPGSNTIGVRPVIIIWTNGR